MNSLSDLIHGHAIQRIKLSFVANFMSSCRLLSQLGSPMSIVLVASSKYPASKNNPAFRLDSATSCHSHNHLTPVSRPCESYFSLLYFTCNWQARYITIGLYMVNLPFRAPRNQSLNSPSIAFSWETKMCVSKLFHRQRKQFSTHVCQNMGGINDLFNDYRLGKQNLRYALGYKVMACPDCGTYSNERQIDTCIAAAPNPCSAGIAGMVRYNGWWGVYMSL